MAVRRPKSRVKGSARHAAPRTRVQTITTSEQFEQLVEKAADRLVVIQFHQAGVYVCAQMRPYFQRMSAEPRFKRIVFAEAEVGQAEEFATACGISRLPTYQVYHQGTLVDSFSGGQPPKLAEMLRAALQQYAPQRSVAQKLLLAAGLVAAGALGFLAWRLTAGSSGGGDASSALREELRRLKQTIAAAQEKLTTLQTSKNPKAARAARAQRKVLEQLQAKKADLERAQRKALKQQPGGSSGSSRAGSPNAGGHSAMYSDDEHAAAGHDAGALDDDVYIAGNASYSDED